MIYEKPRGELRRLRLLADPADLNSEALRPNPLPPYTMKPPRGSELIPTAEVVNSFDELLAWSHDDEIKHALSFASWVAVGKWTRRPRIRTTAFAKANQAKGALFGETAREAVRQSDFNDAFRVLTEWSASDRPGFVPALQSAQRFIALARQASGRSGPERAEA